MPYELGWEEGHYGGRAGLDKGEGEEENGTLSVYSK